MARPFALWMWSPEREPTFLIPPIPTVDPTGLQCGAGRADLWPGVASLIQLRAHPFSPEGKDLFSVPEVGICRGSRPAPSPHPCTSALWGRNLALDAGRCKRGPGETGSFLSFVRKAELRLGPFGHGEGGHPFSLLGPAGPSSWQPLAQTCF